MDRMAKTIRTYSQQTIKELFGCCANQCAEPSCTAEIIVAGTDYSDKAVVGQICHIYAAADNGPRGKPGLTEKERNAASNLILLCAHHHAIVDKQHETYPASMLTAWKTAHETKYSKEGVEATKTQAAMRRQAWLVARSDEWIEDEIERIRKARLLDGYSAKDNARVFAERVDETGEFAGGSNPVRARALAWCARILSTADTTAYARTLVSKAKALGGGVEIVIAEAFLAAHEDRNGALAMLARLNSAEGSEVVPVDRTVC